MGTQKPFQTDPLLETLIERGQQHEAAYVEHLKASGMSVVHVGRGSDRAEPLQAMKNGADVIVQAELRSDRWLGAYEMADTKLS